MSRIAACLLLAFAACSPSAKAPELPNPPLPTFAPLAAALLADSGKGPASPKPAQLSQLSELCTLAFSASSSDRRLATRAANSLRDEPLARWGLEAALRHDEPAVRQGALRQLCSRPLAGSLPLLLMRLKYELEPTTRLLVLQTLAWHGNAAGLRELADAFGQADRSELAGGITIEVLSRAGTPAPEAPTWEQLRTGLAALSAAWTTTGTCSLPAAEAEPELLHARLAQHLLALNGFQLRPVDDARFVFSRLGQLGLAQLLPCLRASETYLRNHALEIAHGLGPVASSASDAVLALLGDPLTRVDAIRALGRMHANAALPTLRAWLDHHNLEVRCACAGALGQLGDRDSAGRLTSLMDDASQAMDLRVQAAASLIVLAAHQPARAFLNDLLARGAYHAPTLRELLEQTQSPR